ncbi:uncharacterized protein LOC134176211 [Corticium candelabrum]|uniref:uncharacterized protein LOC134176211 n=1 Tax=Corticium candelabrum TaxID=121492 RepID=UPI002E2629FC|nr:uncharacterized protein LOC134176211 [Corticium candelabrum]
MSMTVACTCILIVSALIFSSSAMPIEERNFNETIGKPLGGVYGVDVSQPTSQSAFSCLKNNGYSYAIVRAHYSDGGVDKNAVETVANAWSAGMSHVDVYLFPCYSCGDPGGQVRETVDYLRDHGTKYGMLWLDIERSSWSGDKSANQKFFSDMLLAAKLRKVTGVYTSESQWSEIMGDDYTKGSSSQLWYPHYDSNPSFSDFESFGGWSHPAIKQYKGSSSLCATGGMATSDSVRLRSELEALTRSVGGPIKPGKVFKGQRSKPSANNCTIPSRYQTIVYENTEKKGFTTKAPRFDDYLNVNENPGPGSYRVPKEAMKQKDESSLSRRGTGSCASKSDNRGWCQSILIVSALIFSSWAMPIEERNFNETIGKPLGGVYGVDVSQPTSQSAFSCLKNNGYSYAIVRAHHSNGGVDKNAVETVANAWSAGMSHVDVYLFPCYSCGDPEGQVRKTVDYLRDHGTEYGMLWLDIERSSWSGDKSANQKFFSDMLLAAKLRKVTGVYTSESQWSEIMGDDYTKGSSSQLWYPHFDNNPSFSDFESFGGWSHPAIKQYKDSTSLCGAGIDENWYP